MALKTNSAEGYADAATVTAGTSGGASGSAFDLVTVTTSGSCTASTAQSMHGLVAYRFNEATASSVSHLDWIGYSATAMAARYYVYFNVFPAAVTRLSAFRNASGNATSIVIAAPNGSSQSKPNVCSPSGAFLATTASMPVLSTGTWYRIETECRPGTGTTDGYVTFRIYAGDSTTALGTFTSSSIDAGSTSLTQFRVGKLDNTGSIDAYVDDIALNDGSTAPLGPVGANGLVTAVVATATASDPFPTADAEFARSGGGPAIASGVAYPSVSSGNSAGTTARVATGSGAAKSAVTISVTASLVATPAPTNAPPAILLTVSNASGEEVTINRIDGAGNISPVRGAVQGELSGGSFVVLDYEAPYNVAVTYEASTDGALGTSALQTSVTLTVAQPWLVHAGIPSLSRPLTMVQLGTRTLASNEGIHRVLGRSDAIAITDGQRQSATFDLIVRTENLSDEADLATLLDDTSVLLLQIAYDDIERTRYSWVSVGQVTAEDIVDWFGNQYVQWTLPCTEASAPSGAQVSPRTWADVIAQEVSWADVFSDFATWRDEITAITATTGAS